MKKTRVEPRILKGFRDFLPKEKRARDLVISVMKDTFEKYGFEPLETTNLEYLDILIGKYGEEEKLIYSFEDKGGRKVGLRYDLTVPAARVMAQYQNDIPLPFKRYQIQKVWRADKPQKGRLRELYQCDADTFGSPDMIVDAEYILMSIEVLQTLGFEDFRVMLGNRKILDAIYEYSGAKEGFELFVSAIDKFDKIGLDGVKGELEKRGFGDGAISAVENVVTITGSNAEKLTQLEEMLGEAGKVGLGEIREILGYIQAAELEEFVEFSPQLARGLSYYTGPVWELIVRDGDVGSVGGCGRYDNLVGGFLGKDVPASGGTWGLERIIQVMIDREMLPEDEGSADLLVTIFDEKYKTESFTLADVFRNLGLNVLLYPGEAKIGKQFKYADKKGIKWVVILGEDEVKQEKITLKDMETGDQETLSFDEAVEKLAGDLGEVECCDDCDCGDDCNCEDGCCK